MACFSVPTAILAVSFITFVVFPRHHYSTRAATTLTFAYGFSLCGTLLVVSEIRPASKMPVTHVAGETNVGERARRAGYAVATCLVTDVCYITATAFVARPTDVLFAIAPVTFVIT